MRSRLAASFLGAVVAGAILHGQGDGGYTLVPNWIKMPAHVPAFGPGRIFLPPGEREADAARKRKAGFHELVEAQPGIGGIAVDRQDRIYVLQRRAELPIMVFDSEGRYLYGGGGDIFSQDSHFVEVDREGNVWGVDRENQRIIKYNNRLDTILMVLGTKGVPGCDATHFNRPTDMAFLSNGDIIVTDGYVNHRVVRYTKEGKFIKMWGGCGPEGAGSGDGQLRLSHAVEVDRNDTLYVVDRENKRIVVFDKEGKFIRNIVGAGYAWGIALSPDQQHIFATDHDTETVTKIQVSDGKLVARFGLGKGWGPGQFDWAHGIAVDSKGAVYVSETYGARLQKYVPGSR
jgi:DNA-binding beta-propeller fold protein YncE